LHPTAATGTSTYADLRSGRRPRNFLSAHGVRTLRPTRAERPELAQTGGAEADLAKRSRPGKVDKPAGIRASVRRESRRPVCRFPLRDADRVIGLCVHEGTFGRSEVGPKIRLDRTSPAGKMEQLPQGRASRFRGRWFGVCLFFENSTGCFESQCQCLCVTFGNLFVRDTF
jgi:hypothetical protein